jgi:hypothetical protein
MKIRCPYCNRNVSVADSEMGTQSSDETRPSRAPWIAAIVVAVGIAGPLGLLGGTLLTRSGEEQAQSQAATPQAKSETPDESETAAQVQVTPGPADLQAKAEKLHQWNLRLDEELKSLRKENLRLRNELQETGTGRSSQYFPDATRPQRTTEPSRSLIGVDTPLGTVEDVATAGGGRMTVGSQSVKPGHVCVLLTVTARETREVSGLQDWVLADPRGRRYPWIGIMTEGGTIQGGLDYIKAVGTARSPETCRFVFEVPADVDRLDLYVGGSNMGVAINNQARRPQPGTRGR